MSILVLSLFFPFNNRGLAVGRLIYFVKHTQRLLLEKVHTIRADSEFATVAFMDFFTQEIVKPERSVI